MKKKVPVPLIIVNYQLKLGIKAKNCILLSVHCIGLVNHVLEDKISQVLNKLTSAHADVVFFNSSIDILCFTCISTVYGRGYVQSIESSVKPPIISIHF